MEAREFLNQKRKGIFKSEADRISKQILLPSFRD